jgi:hypothetical protein
MVLVLTVAKLAIEEAVSPALKKGEEIFFVTNVNLVSS